ncbi:baseplate J/gp47 family protein [Ulvibacter antarcticus]|uniref:Baseplate J-like protein n=1 Tax=Ulvibacter antarcticus TaxID=442714 RepID=A0A3L9YDT9_9FLAO|nr:baseplate J/gp47 family protein [Ulvibacter antarcticus]RMA58866.1 baseplate J-like protein [Ulvibacter antarcticus]
MSEKCEHNDLLLQRNGTSQSERYVSALDPASVQLHDLNTEDWMRFALKFSKEINYFETETNAISGDWEEFFIAEPEIQQFVQKLEQLGSSEVSSEEIKSDIKSHLTLFAAFLKLTSFSQEQLNGLTKKHLDFYYKRVLQLQNNEAVEDKVHILFELAKKATEVRVELGTELNAGKDALGLKRTYETKNELIVNKTQVVSLRNVLHQDGVGIKNAIVANSFDGLGADFPEDETHWWPFGYPSKDPAITVSEQYPNLPFARTGFGIASPVLLMNEGKRIVIFTFDLSTFTSQKIKISEIDKAINVFFSGEKEWIEGTILTPECSISNSKLTLVVSLNEGDDPVVAYNSEVLLEPYNTTDAVARFLIKNDSKNTNGYLFQKIFSATTVKNVTIDIEVEGIQDIDVENDLGVLDASKPFYPFGPQPVDGSNFFIGLPEALNKDWTDINIDLSWKDKPDLRSTYTAYRSQFAANIGKARYTLTVDSNGSIGGETGLTRIVENDDYFKIDLKVLHNGVWQDINSYNLFNEGGWDIVPTTQFSIKEEKTSKGFQDVSTRKIGIIGKGEIIGRSITSISAPNFGRPTQKFSAAVKKGFIKVILNHSFLHDMFPKIFSVALSKEDTTNTLIPNEPYSPQIESISITYKATANHKEKEVTLFHEHPFGVSEESLELKKESVLKNADRVLKLLPTYNQGSLYIGMENAENLQQVALLIQALEGSENPETPNEFGPDEKLEWSILCNNEWLSLNQNFIVSNETDNFLKSGIIRLSIPKEATNNNTKLPSGLVWLQIYNPKDYDTVSQLIDIKAQAVLAQFDNNNNDLSHLEFGLPAKTIAKLSNRLAQIKGIEQPFNSFDGKNKETDAEFYRRVSERLRHKQRAITIWDYEHLVLQQFPDVFKVKCINHTTTNSFLAPGEVTVVVIPNIVNKNVYDAYKPRISKAKRNEIESFINLLNTLHVVAKIINPVYQEVKVTLSAKFYLGMDENFYSKQLQKDIAKLLSPWAFEESAEITFGVTLHESTVINYIEELGYVDYITDFQLHQQSGKTATGASIFSPVNKVVPANAKVILTSVKYSEHGVTPITADQGCVVLPTVV